MGQYLIQLECYTDPNSVDDVFFSIPPSGYTPIVTALKYIFELPAYCQSIIVSAIDSEIDNLNEPDQINAH